MKNIAFVLWMLGWPLTYAVNNYLGFLTYGKVNTHFSPSDRVMTLFMLIWIGVGALLYESRKKQ